LEVWGEVGVEYLCGGEEIGGENGKSGLGKEQFMPFHALWFSSTAQLFE
jgi:hypothetical protein